MVSGAQTTRADIAAAKRVKAVPRAKQIRSHIKRFAEDPEKHTRALRALGVRPNAIRAVRHASTRTGRSFTGGRSLAPKKLAPLGSEAISPAQRRADLRRLAQSSKRIQSGPHLHPFRDILDVTTGIPSAIDMVRHGHNSISLKKIANPTDALPLVAGLATGGGAHVKETPAPAPRREKTYRPRMIQHNDLNQQLPKSRSRIARALVEKPADKISARLQRSEKARKTVVVKHLTTEQRVTKAAGRAQRVEGARAQAAMAHHLRVLEKVKADSPEDVAHYWYAQLPKSHRNVEGLKLVRGKQNAHLEDLLSGKFAKSLDRQTNAMQAERRKVAFGTPEWTRLANKLEQIDNIKTDLPRRIQDTSASVANLDRVIARAPAVRHEVIDAMHALSKERKRILVESKRLKPEKAAERTGIVSRWVGLEPSGEEAYVGHRLPAKGRTGPSAPSAGVGRVRNPKGTGTKNRLVLAETGRLRPSVHVAAEDWHHAQVFEQANKARSDLSKMAVPYQGHVPEGHVLLNPKGQTIPAHWRSDELAQFGEGWDDVAAIRSQAEEIVKGFTAHANDPEAVAALKRAADSAGVKRSELRVMREDLVHRYYKQFRRMAPPRGKGAKAVDAMTDAVAASIIFARIGYVPKNVVQNVVMALPHQGARFPRNAARAAQVMADPELRTLLKAEVGFSGASRELGAELSTTQKLGRIPHKVAGASGAVADDLFRISAFLHEAAAEGVIGKLGPLLTETDKRALLALLKDKTQRPLLNDVRSRSTEAMADFSRLTPDQSRLARRFVVIPSWLMAGSRYPFHFALNHPIRSALLAYVAMGEPGAPDYLKFNKSADKYFTKGVAPWLQGIKVPGGKVLRTGSLDPVSTPWELAQAGVQTARGKTNPFDYTHETAFDFAAPLLSTGVDALSGGGAKSLERLVPGEKFARQMISPKASKYYPEDATRLGRLKREVGVLPIAVAADTPHERQIARYKTFRQDLEKVLRAVGVRGISPQVEGRLRLRVDRAFARSAAKDPLVADVELMQHHRWISPEKATSAKHWLQTATPEERSNFSRYLTEHYFDPGSLLAGGVRQLRKQGHKIKLPQMPSSKRK